MPFKPGESGNRNGRPVGSQNKRTQLGKLLEPHAVALVNKAVEMALNGEPTALRLCLERLIPKIKNEPICLGLPEDSLNNAEALLHLSTHVIELVASGDITPEQATKLTTLIEMQRKSIELVNVDTRLTVIEKILKHRS